MRVLKRRDGPPLWKTTGAGMLGLLLFYFAIPLSSDAATPRLVFGFVLTLLGVGVIGFVIFRYVIEAYEGIRETMTIANVLLVLEIVVVVFALGYYILATEGTHQIAGIETRLDSLYFTLVTLSTVGYGDIHATGQIARALVTTQIVFNLVLVGSLVSITTHRVGPRPIAGDQPDKRN